MNNNSSNTNLYCLCPSCSVTLCFPNHNNLNAIKCTNCNTLISLNNLNNRNNNINPANNIDNKISIENGGSNDNITEKDRILLKRLASLKSTNNPIQIYLNPPTQDQLITRLAKLNDTKTDNNNQNNSNVNDQHLLARFNQLTETNPNSVKSNNIMNNTNINNTNNNTGLISLSPIQTEEEEIEELTQQITQEIQLQNQVTNTNSHNIHDNTSTNTNDIETFMQQLHSLPAVNKDSINNDEDDEEDEVNAIINEAMDHAALDTSD